LVLYQRNPPLGSAVTQCHGLQRLSDSAAGLPVASLPLTFCCRWA